MQRFVLNSSRRYDLPLEFDGNRVVFLPSLVGNHLSVERQQGPSLLPHTGGVAEIDDVSLNPGHEYDIVFVAGFNHRDEVFEHFIGLDEAGDGEYVGGENDAEKLPLTTGTSTKKLAFDSILFPSLLM